MFEKYLFTMVALGALGFFVFHFLRLLIGRKVF
jgi:hypothetical protein